MAVDRRTFFSQMLGAGACSGLAAILPADLLAQADAHASRGTAGSGQLDNTSASYEFWKTFLDPVNPNVPGSKGGGEKKPKLADQNRVPHFFHYSAGHGIRLAESLTDVDLPDIPGDVLVNIAPGAFKVGGDDEKELVKERSAHLRLDFIQTKSYMNVLPVMAWSALAALFSDKANKLPTLQQLQFKSSDSSPSGSFGSVSGANRILLPAGRGKIALNASIAKQESLFHKFLSNTIKVAKMVAPLVSMPAISIPALAIFTDLYGQLQQIPQFLLNSPPHDVAVTKSAIDDPDLEEGFLRLAPGEFVVVPEAHAAMVSKEMNNLHVVSGYLVRKDADPNLPVLQRAAAALPGVTYVVMKVTVTKAPDPSSTPAKSSSSQSTNAQSASGGENSGNGSGGKSKSTAGKGRQKPPPPKKP
jgi:hypothetical protein